MHRAPRFGHTSNLSKLASTNTEEQNDYINGVIAFSIFVLCIFIVWAFKIIIFKCLGGKKVGCAAGRVIQHDTTARGKARAMRVEDRVQLLFFLCACAIFLASGILVGVVMPSVQEASLHMSELNVDAQALVYEGIAISAAASRAQDELRKVDMDVLASADTFCPNADEAIVFDLNEKFKGTIEQISGTLEKLDEYMTSDADEVNKNLNSILTATLRFDEAIVWVQDHDWMVKMFVLLIGVLTFFLMLGVCLSRAKKSTPPVQYFMAYLITPAFFAVLVCGWIVTSASAAVTIINADFCNGGDTGSPEETLVDVLSEKGIKEGDTLMDAFMYYRSGCLVGDNPASFMKEYEKEVVLGLGSSSAFEAYISENGIELMNYVCGSDITPVLENVRLLAGGLETTLQGLRRAQAFASCSRISPLYRRLFRGSTCGESVYGLSSLFCCFLVISVCGMTMLSSRAAMYRRRIPDDVDDDAEDTWQDRVDDKWEEYKAYMSRYYDTKPWKRQELPSDNPDGIDAVGTFETESCSQSWDDSSEEYAVCDGSLRSPTAEELTPLSPPTYTYS